MQQNTEALSGAGSAARKLLTALLVETIQLIGAAPSAATKMTARCLKIVPLKTIPPIPAEEVYTARMVMYLWSTVTLLITVLPIAPVEESLVMTTT